MYHVMARNIADIIYISLLRIIKYTLRRYYFAKIS